MISFGFYSISSWEKKVVMSPFLVSLNSSSTAWTTHRQSTIISKTTPKVSTPFVWASRARLVINWLVNTTWSWFDQTNLLRLTFHRSSKGTSLVSGAMPLETSSTETNRWNVAMSHLTAAFCFCKVTRRPYTSCKRSLTWQEISLMTAICDSPRSGWELSYLFTGIRLVDVIHNFYCEIH